MQNISQYQKENPEVYVDLEVGVTEDNGVTASDALKNLSTEIMAGNGPDILMLDGLPVDSYVEKGMLEDLSDVAAQAEDLFENLMAGMEEDGKLYGIPLRFSIPLVEADTQYPTSMASCWRPSFTMRAPRPGSGRTGRSMRRNWRNFIHSLAGSTTRKNISRRTMVYLERDIRTM